MIRIAMGSSNTRGVSRIWCAARLIATRWAVVLGVLSCIEFRDLPQPVQWSRHLIVGFRTFLLMSLSSPQFSSRTRGSVAMLLGLVAWPMLAQQNPPERVQPGTTAEKSTEVPPDK